ncbi:hypothetical protein ACFSTC_41400 [Nonomuraea ferruginea]
MRSSRREAKNPGSVASAGDPAGLDLVADHSLNVSMVFRLVPRLPSRIIRPLSAVRMDRDCALKTGSRWSPTRSTISRTVAAWLSMAVSCSMLCSVELAVPPCSRPASGPA